MTSFMKTCLVPWRATNLNAQLATVSLSPLIDAIAYGTACNSAIQLCNDPRRPSVVLPSMVRMYPSAVDRPSGVRRVERLARPLCYGGPSVLFAVATLADRDLVIPEMQLCAAGEQRVAFF